ANLVTVSLPRTEARPRSVNIEELAPLAVNGAKLQTVQQGWNEWNGIATSANHQCNTIANIFLTHLKLNRETVALENAQGGIGKVGARHDLPNLRNQISAWTQ